MGPQEQQPPPENTSLIHRPNDQIDIPDDTLARSVVGLMSCVRGWVRDATFAIGFGSLCGAVAAQVCMKFQFCGVTTGLGIIGMVSIGACFGRRLDKRGPQSRRPR